MQMIKMRTKKTFQFFIVALSFGVIWLIFFPRTVTRIHAYECVKRDLELLKNEELEKLLAACAGQDVTYVGTQTGTLVVGKTNVFFKKIPLTELEARPENIRSTRNIFSLPPCYYRVGSAGFGVWRELFCHQEATRWVLDGECPSFPLLYGWRILPRKENLRHQIIMRENTMDDEVPEVQQRLLAIETAPYELVLFLEYIPHLAIDWLDVQLAKNPSRAIAALAHLEKEASRILAFCQKKGLLHSDPHLLNFLTNGSEFFLSDFGLASYTKFELSAEERQTHNSHTSYPERALHYYLMAYITEKLIKYDEETHKFVMKNNMSLDPWLKAFLIAHLPTACANEKVFEEMANQKDLAFPSDEEFEKEIEAQRDCLCMV